MRPRLRRRRALRGLLVAIGAALWIAAPAQAEPTHEPPVRHHAVWRYRSHLVVDGAPTPLLWAVGISDPEELGAYASLGFNAVELVITTPSARACHAAEGMARAAAERGLHVLLTLAPEAPALRAASGAGPADGADSAYRQAVRNYLEPIVARCASLPGLVAWVVEAVDCETLPFDQPGFRDYLLRRYGSAAGVAQAWGAKIGDLGSISERFVADLDSAKPLGLGRASLDLARYRADAYRDLLEVWAQEIRRLDRRHVVLAGRQRSYRAAICVPTSYDGMLLGLYPGVAEDDLETHNVHGVDVARRANQFAAFPMLKVSAARSGAQLATWVALAALHGAAGIGFAHWSDLRARADLRESVRQALLVSRELRLCPRVVVASSAILYEPFAAGGFAGSRPLYGWLAGASTTEPGNLFRALARGTVYGPLDYLSQSDLRSVSLARYSTIIAPLAFSLAPPEQDIIARYAARGGTFAADLGLAFEQSGSLDDLPPTLRELFGVSPVSGTRQGPTNFMALAPHPRFPSLRREMGTASPPLPASFEPPIHFVMLSSGAAPVLAEWDSAPAFAGITARPHDQGWAVYATTRLWQDWRPGNLAFDAFHRDLFGFASPAALKQERGIVPGDDFAVFEDGSVMVLKRTAPPTELLLRNPQGTVYRIWGGVQEVRAGTLSANSLLVLGRRGLQVADPLPIQVSTDAPRLLVQVIEYAERAISLALYGPQSRILPQQDGALSVSMGGQAVAHLRLASGAYPLRPGARHEIRVRPLRKERSAISELTVSAARTLELDAAANTAITIIPVSALGAAPRQQQGRSAPPQP